GKNRAVNGVLYSGVTTTSSQCSLYITLLKIIVKCWETCNGIPV
ncbi:18796_t:CDS:1, partial [Racocetra persica]